MMMLSIVQAFNHPAPARRAILRHAFHRALGRGVTLIVSRVAVSGLASLIVMGVEHRLSHPGALPAPAAATAPEASAPDNRADASEEEATLRRIIDRDASMAVISFPAPHPIALPSSAPLPRPRTSTAPVAPMPPSRPPFMVAFGVGEGHDRSGPVPPRPAGTLGKAVRPDASAIPLPPPRPAAEGSAGHEYVLAASSARSLPRTFSRVGAVPAPSPSDAPGGAPQVMEGPGQVRGGIAALAFLPLRYGMGLAAEAGAVAIATNASLLSGTTDTISGLVR